MFGPLDPNKPYNTLRGVNFSHPFTQTRRLASNNYTITPKIEYPIFKTENGYPTVINRFNVIMDFGPFQFTNFFRCGLRINGRPFGEWRDGCYAEADPGFPDGTDILRSNGFLPMCMVNGLFNMNWDFYYIAQPHSQISLVIEQFDMTQVFDQQKGLCYVAGAQLAA